ncbi:hypothetical protein PIB30_053174 [Stylosanthes scabra]|uniref:Secreted protein n=1 Tax=Stylosanthes scabra TaxID=79078 RepID=A0ABU6VHC0_9FABA|nr:hypothetical protein [Stylosanthes scabra]
MMQNFFLRLTAAIWRGNCELMLVFLVHPFGSCGAPEGEWEKRKENHKDPNESFIKRFKIGINYTIRIRRFHHGKTVSGSVCVGKKEGTFRISNDQDCAIRPS